MTDRERLSLIMEDKDIVKALECEIECNKGLKKHCIGCLLQKHYPYCEEKVIEYALDLINRLQAENERLQAYHDDMESAIYSFREDHAKVKFFKKEIKAEAYKEFAELVHCHCESIINHEWNKKVSPVSWADAYEQFDEEVDNLLKEMVGEDK